MEKQGANEAAEDLPFRHYKLRHRVIAWVSTNLFDSLTYTVRHGLLKGMRRKGGLGWIPEILSGSVETAESRFWRELDLRGATVYDIGAFHGLLTLYFASRAKAVVCFEPNTVSHRRLLDNLRLNDVQNVQVRKIGIGSRREALRMAVDPLMPGGATVHRATVEGLLRGGRGMWAEEIPITTLDEEIEEFDLRAPDFIKFDIEGFEIEALRGARRTLEAYKPALFLEMHGETIREKKTKAAEIADYLWALGYRDILHVESGTRITPANSEVAMEGHLYCRPA